MISGQRRTRVALAILVVGILLMIALLMRRSIRRSVTPVSNASVENGNPLTRPVAAAAPEPVAPTLLRVAMLPLADRTTVVAEFSGPLPHAEEVEAAAGTINIEAGPVQPGVRPEDLTPAVASRQVSLVSVRELDRPDGEKYVSLIIKSPGSADHRLRVAGSRIYVDFTPGAGAPAAGDASRAARQAEALASRRPPGNDRLTQVPSPPEAGTSTENVDLAYRALESATMRRGAELASRPDVKGLLKLRAEVERRDKQLGQRRPADVERILAQILKLTDSARTAQLERDRREFLREKP
jgi:hypothetical protein